MEANERTRLSVEAGSTYDRPFDGSRWNPDHGHDFPRQYLNDEIELIKAIASAAIEAMRPTDLDGAHQAMLDAATHYGKLRDKERAGSGGWL